MCTWSPRAFASELARGATREQVPKANKGSRRQAGRPPQGTDSPPHSRTPKSHLTLGGAAPRSRDTLTRSIYNLLCHCSLSLSLPSIRACGSPKCYLYWLLYEGSHEQVDFIFAFFNCQTKEEPFSHLLFSVRSFPPFLNFCCLIFP